MCKFFKSYEEFPSEFALFPPKFYTVRKNFTGPPVPTVLTNSKSGNKSIRPLLSYPELSNI